MRLLHLTDTHLGADRWFRGAPKGWRRADDHLAAMREALGPAERGEVDLVVHTGDLFDRSRPPARAVREAAELLARVARIVPVVLLPGNHDRRGLGGHFPGGIPGVEVVDRPRRVDVRGVALGVVPYCAEAAAWAVAAAPLAGVDLLVCHQSFHGARVPGFTFREGAQRETVGPGGVPKVGAVLCGHIHPRQVVRLGEVDVVHPGATERTSFVERGEAKGYAIWEVGARVSWRFVDLPARPMVVVRGPEDLAAVRPGALVHVAAADPDALEAQVAAAGGWLTPRRLPTAQVPLFGAGPRRDAGRFAAER